MNKQISLIALILIALFAIFVVLQPIIPSSSEKYSQLGLLGSNQKIGDYPTNLTLGQTFLLYGYVGNHEGVSTYYDVLIKMGNQSTLVTNTTSANVPTIASYSQILLNNQSWTFPVNLSLNNTGINLKLIFELWYYNVKDLNFEYTGLFNIIYVNVTKT